MFEPAITHGEFALAAVFCNDDSVGSKNLPATNASKKIKRAGVFVFCLVGGVQKNDIDRLRQFAEALQHGSHTAIFQCEASNNSQRQEIPPKGCQRRLSVFREPHVGGSSAECFDTNSP